MNAPRALALALVVVLASGCGAWTYTKAMFVSGVSLEALGEQFIQVSEQVTAGCAARVIPAPTCTRYRAFGENFKATYPLTVGLWKAARKAGDTTSQAKAEDVARALGADLTRLAVEALGAFAPKEP